MIHEFLTTFTPYITITFRLAWGLYPRFWDHRSHALIQSHLSQRGA